MKFRAITVKQWLDEESQPGEPRLSPEMLNGWVVLEGKIPRFSRRMTEAEARIIEFAFTGLQNNSVLIAVDKEEFDRIPASITLNVYNGPTDGVIDGANQ